MEKEVIDIEFSTRAKIVIAFVLLLITALILLDIANGTTFIREAMMYVFDFLVVIGGYNIVRRDWQIIWNNSPAFLFALTAITALVAIFAALFGYYNELPDTYMGGVGGLAILTFVVFGVVNAPKISRML